MYQSYIIKLLNINTTSFRKKRQKTQGWQKYMVPYSAKVKTPLRGWSSNFRTLLEPALDAKISSHGELNFGTPR
jgi:hypothetical protein